jgi:hypothetical protein
MKQPVLTAEHELSLEASKEQSIVAVKSGNSPRGQDWGFQP